MLRKALQDSTNPSAKNDDGELRADSDISGNCADDPIFDEVLDYAPGGNTDKKDDASLAIH